MKFAKMWFSDPVFDANDRVPDGGGGDGLPAELAGKSPAEIARFYQERETRLRAELTTAPPVTKETFWNDPAKSTREILAKNGVSREEYEMIRKTTAPALIYAAKASVKEQHPDFDRVKDEIDKIMATVPEWQHTDPNMWETAYTYAKGRAHERLAAEDRVKPPVSTGEVVQPGGTAPPPNADLSTVTLPGLKPTQNAGSVADRLGVSHDSYRKSQKILDGDGLLPLTVDNRGSR
jgi:hypothetical protein